jgi:hypothetical protein
MATTSNHVRDPEAIGAALTAGAPQQHSDAAAAIVESPASAGRTLTHLSKRQGTENNTFT